MDEEKKGGSDNLSLPTLLLALALAGGSLLWKSPPLFSPRPPGEASAVLGSERDQRIPARLWQDPLGALDRAKKSARPNETPNTAGGSANQVDENGAQQQFYITVDEFGKFLKQRLEGDTVGSPGSGAEVMLVMVPDSMYAEYIETRLRMREALMSAYSHAGYQTEDEEHIGAVQLKWDTSKLPQSYDNSQVSKVPELGKNETTLPFEWFERRNNNVLDPTMKRHALVIWLPVSLFENDPLFRLAQLVGQVRFRAGTWRDKLKFDVMGPVGSTVLREMLPWRKALPLPMPARNTGKPLVLSGVRMFSWNATAQDELLVHGWQSPTPRSNIRDYLKSKWGLEFINTTATDDQLSAELADELSLRNVDLTDPAEHAALIFEWDSFYGRTLPTTFTAEVFRRQRHWMACSDNIRKSVDAILKAPSKKWPDAISGAVQNVHAFTYLRGIDGKLLKEESPEAPAKTKTTTVPAKDRYGVQEMMNRAEGQNQFDYVPRIALQLSDLDRRLKSGELDEGGKPGRLSAIGVVGGDFYDKLLILEGLRQHFPNAVFFTTDLDARFLDPEFERWTRNLVVASNFGLTLDRKIQREAPAFRGNYQTAFFYAALSALNQIREDQFSIPPAPRRFEIGHVTPVDLSITFDAAKVQPNPSRHYPTTGKILLVLGMLVAGLSLLRGVVPSIRRSFNAREREVSRQNALFFTDEQILDPVAVFSSERLAPHRACLPAELPSPRMLEKIKQLAPGNKDAQLAACELNELARCCASWLNNLLLKGPCNADGKEPLAQRGRTKPLDALKLRTKRIKKRREVLEKWFPREVRGAHGKYRIVTQKLGGDFLGAILTAIAAAIFIGIMAASHAAPNGEPFSLFEGVSAWPCEIIRFLALILTIFFFFKARNDIRANEAALSSKFFLRDFHEEYSLLHWWKLLRRRMRNQPLSTLLISALRSLWEFRAGVDVIGWTWQRTAKSSASSLWRGYQKRSAFVSRIVRTIFRSTVYVVFLLCLSLLDFEQPYAPVRGALARHLDHCLLPAVVFASIFLNLFVADAARLARTFIRHLSYAPTAWPPIGGRLAVKMNGKDDFESMDEWLDIRFIEILTETVAKLVYYPFIILGLLIVARVDYFDSWTWPTSLVLVFIFNSLWCVFSAFLLQSAAADAKKAALDSLRNKRAAVEPNSAVDRSKLLDEAYEQVKATRKGAFTGYLDNPALKALVLPFSGAGLLNLINFLTNK